jgi:LemA protein
MGVASPAAAQSFKDKVVGAWTLETVERYPDLKSNQNFLALQSQLEGTENRIAVARRDYIEGVRVYNTELKTVPGLLWASTIYRSYKPMETFTVAEDLQKPPTVKF